MISFSLFLFVYLAVFLLAYTLDLTADKLNAAYIKKYGTEVPAAFKGIINEGELAKTCAYTLENITVSTAQKTVSKIFFILVIFSGLLPRLSEFLTHFNTLFAGLVFFGVLGIFSVILLLPFDFYHTFVIEEKFGFNTKTTKVWLTDLFKSLLIIAILGSVLFSSLLAVIHYSGQLWWVWAWAVFSCFQILMILLYPMVIAPLFNTFSPVENPELRRKIEELAQKEDLRIHGIFQMDATKRTRHTNAYFTGLGKVKRIVLFDSLISTHSH